MLSAENIDRVCMTAHTQDGVCGWRQDGAGSLSLMTSQRKRQTDRSIIYSSFSMKTASLTCLLLLSS